MPPTCSQDEEEGAYRETLATSYRNEPVRREEEQFHWMLSLNVVEHCQSLECDLCQLPLDLDCTSMHAQGSRARSGRRIVPETESFTPEACCKSFELLGEF